MIVECLKYIIIIFVISVSITFCGECDNWKINHPEWLHCDDFEIEHDISVNYQDYSTNNNNFKVTDTDSFEGKYSLEQHYETSQVDAGWISWWFCDTIGGNYGDCQDTIYMRWYHKFEDNFEGIPPKMARITSIQSGWNKVLGVYFWNEDSSHEYCIAADVRAHDGWFPIIRTDFKYADQSNIGRWVCLEMMVKAGISGGYTYWADNVKIADNQNVDVNGPYNYNNAMLDCYWNGGSPKAQKRFFDNFVISKNRIGCINGNIDDDDNDDDNIDQKKTRSLIFGILGFSLFVLLIVIINIMCLMFFLCKCKCNRYNEKKPLK